MFLPILSELKHEEEEPSDLANISPVPPLIQAVHEMSQFAFSVEPEPFEEEEEVAAAAEAMGRHLFGAEVCAVIWGYRGGISLRRTCMRVFFNYLLISKTQLVKINALAEVVLKSGAAATDSLALDDQQQENGICHNQRQISFAETTTADDDDEQLQNKQQESETRRQMVSVGKQPKGGGTARRKKDMVRILFLSKDKFFSDKTCGSQLVFTKCTSSDRSNHYTTP